MFAIGQTVTPSKTDSEGRLKLFCALQLMQDCSEMWKDSEPAFQKLLLDNHAAQLLNFRQVEVLRVPKLGEHLTCRTSVYGVQGAFGYRNTAIYDEQEQPCYRCWCIGAFVSAESGRLVRTPQAVVERMKIEPPLPMEYGERKVIPPADCAEQPMPPIPVQRNDIDYNRHVNNAHYIRMAMELLPEGFEPTNLRVEYKRPVALGATIEPAIIPTPDAVWVLMRVAGTLCCAMEFRR